MTEYTARLGESTNTGSLGGKGANLSALIAGGLPVPDGFVVTTDAYRDFTEAAAVTDADPERLRATIRTLPMPTDIADAIVSAYVAMGTPAVAVRSSGTAEDLEDVSFAGQHDTYLGIVGANAVIAAVRDCWASLWTPRAIAYRKRLSWDEHGIALAVVVQRMVDAEWAGVMFTVDPVSGRRSRVVLEAVRGLGDALVSGEVTGEHVEVDKGTGALVSGRSAMPQQAISELVALGCDVESRFRAPQDIEWTYAAGHVALVQARPLTALPEEPVKGRSASKRTKKSLGMFAVTADHMPYPPFPMDVSLIYRPALRAILDGIRSAGFSVPPLNEVLVEIDDGVVQIVPPRIRPRWRATWRVPAVMPKLVRAIGTKTDDWRARSDDTLVPLAERLDREDLSGLNEAELLERAHELIDTIGALMPSRFGALMSGMAAEAAIAPLLRAMVGRNRADELHAGLMADVPCTMTAANADLERIAALVRTSPALREIYLVEDPADVASRLGDSVQGRALLTEIDAHLRSYGFRSMSIFTVGLPPLRDSASVVHGYLKGLAQLDENSGRNANGRLDRARSELASLTGARARLLRPVVAALLASARDGAGFRDDSQYALELCLAVTRRILLELGCRLVERGVLGDADDFAYLDVDGVHALSPAETRRIVERRKAARTASLDHYTVIPTELFDPSSYRDRVEGMPASRGRAVGRVRVIHDETEFAMLQAGEVLVCPFTNPAWTPLFSLAAAVVVDSGGAASHAAIVAREVGIPAVMGTGNGTRILRDGQRVLVDADQGIVVRIGAEVVADSPRLPVPARN